MQGARCGYNMREIVNNEVRASFEKIISINTVPEMRARFEQLKKLIDQQNSIPQKVSRPTRDLYQSDDQISDLGFVKDFLGRDESRLHRNESHSASSARLTFDSERSIIEQLEQHKKIDLDDLIEKCTKIALNASQNHSFP